MPYYEQDFQMWAGDHRNVGILVEDVETLQGCYIVWAAACFSDLKTKLIKKTSDNGGIVIEDNKAIVKLLASDTRNLKEKKLSHELKVIDPQGRPFTATKGTMTISDPLYYVDEEGAVSWRT